MKPAERENQLYLAGKTSQIALEETLLFDWLIQYVTPPKVVVDVGCGPGDIAQALIGRGYDVYGFDFASVAVEKALAKNIRAQVVDLDEAGVPLPDACVDCVYAGDVVEHVFDPMFLFREFWRVLRNDGVVVASLPHDVNLSAVRAVVLGRSYQEPIYAHLQQCKHHSYISVGLVKLFATQANLALVELALIGRKTPLSRVEQTVRYYRRWEVPLWSKYLASKLCIVLKKSSMT